MKKLGVSICKIDVGTPKIVDSRLETYGIIIASFQVVDNNEKSRFFEKTCLLTYIGMDISFRMLLFTLGNVEINFNYQELI